jgi:hypothetical protein
MKLTTISWKNLKGSSGAWDLRAINVLVGPNAAGKTTRLDAIALLLLGYHPALGKLSRSTFSLCSGRDLEVQGEFDNGWRLSRRWYLKGDSVKSEVSLPPGLEEEDPVLAVMLDASTYFALSDREKVAYISANVPAPESGGDQVPVSALIEAELAKNEELSTGAIERLIAGLMAAADERRLALEPGETWTRQDSIEHALEFCVEAEKNAKAQAAKMQQTAQGLSALRAADEKPFDLSILDAKKAELDRKIIALHADKARYKALADQNRANNTRRAELANLPAQQAALEEKIAARRDSIAQIASALELIPGVDAEEQASLVAERRDTDRTIAGLEADLRTLNISIAKDERDLAEISALKACPYCGAAGDGWREIKRLEIEGRLVDLRGKKDLIEHELSRSREHSANLTIKIGQATGHQNARTAKKDELAKAKGDLAPLEIQLANLVGRSEEIGRIPTDDPKPVADYETARSAIAVAEDELRKLEEQRRAAISRNGDLKRLAEAETGRDQAKLDQAVAKAAAEAVREIKARSVAETFGPLLAIANGIFGGILKSPISYHDGQVGTWRDGVWVSHQTFSGTEKLLTYAAIQAALASKAAVRLMILDELGRVDDTNLANVMAQIAIAIGDSSVDQAICVDNGRARLYREKAIAPVGEEETLQVLEIA